MILLDAGSPSSPLPAGGSQQEGEFGGAYSQTTQGLRSRLWVGAGQGRMAAVSGSLGSSLSVF